LILCVARKRFAEEIISNASQRPPAGTRVSKFPKTMRWSSTIKMKAVMQTEPLAAVSQQRGSTEKRVKFGAGVDHD
jgi:hypothetical protein